MTARIVTEPTLRLAHTEHGTEWECLTCGTKWTRRLFDDAVKEAVRHQRDEHDGDEGQ